MTKEEAIKLLHRDTTRGALAKLEYYAGFNGEKVIEQIQEAMDMGAEALKQTAWIPCSDRLPDNAQHKGAFCPMYQVMTKYGVTEGWYNPDCESWYVLFWFRTTRFHETDIDFRGDIPKVVKIPLKAEIVTAWQPLPGPYNEEEQ